jgi:gas vesicle protein
MSDTDTHERETHGRTGAFLLGALCGAAAGVAAGLLFAPQSGEAFRRQLAASTERLRQRAMRTYVDATAAYHDAVNDGLPLE